MPNAGVPIGVVHSMAHVENWQTSDRLLEIFTGWVGINFNQYDSDNDLRGEVRTFIPVAPNTVKPYLWEHRDRLISVAVTAAPAAISADEAETIDAVDAARVAVEKQPFLPGVSNAACLILRADIAVKRSVFHSFTYQVTALWRNHEQLPPVLLPESQVPD